MNVRRWREKKTNKKMRKSPNIGFFLISHFSFPYSFPVCFCVVIVWCLISLMNSSRIYLRNYPLLISRFPTHFPVVSFEVQCYGVRFGDKLYGGLGAGFYGMVWYCMVWYCIVWYCMVLYGIVWYCIVLYGIVLYPMLWYGMEAGG